MAFVLISIIYLFLFIIFLAVFLTVFWILMIIDVAKRKFKNENDKIVWILIVILLSWLGAIIYYFVVKRHNKH
ncbi:MAG: PLDc N-terminal domain-containing protein [Nanoarchaeota archaeon]